MIKYADFGPDKPLNEIVMAGSHDAGITEGGKNAMTQDRDILGQAIAGVRVFDLRVAGQVVKGAGGAKHVEMRAIHADGLAQVKGKFSGVVSGLSAPKAMATTKIRHAPVIGDMGTFGQSLTKMLTDARRFVETFPSEFLILKFDKSKNWAAIAEACVALLGDRLYTGGGLLNTRKLNHLAGKVVVLFTPAGFAEAHAAGYRHEHGILEVVNLYSAKSAIGKGFAGMTYFGKGGTNPLKSWGKFKDNQKKQASLMAKAGNADPNVMGMMYWTTTGLFESIRRRNDKMWNVPSVQKLQGLWASGLKANYVDRLGRHVDVAKPGSAQTLKLFMPNIVMIDFADPIKCQVICDLNNLSATEISRAVQGFGED